MANPTRRRTLVKDHIHTFGVLKKATRGGDVLHHERAHVEEQIHNDDGVYRDGSKNKTGNKYIVLLLHVCRSNSSTVPPLAVQVPSLENVRRFPDLGLMIITLMIATLMIVTTS